MRCIELKRRFGQYRIKRDPSGGAKTRDPWNWIIPGKYADCYPHGGNMLGVATHKRGRVASRLAALPFVQVVQDGDDGVNAIFHIDDFAEVARLVRLRRRVRLSAEERERRANVLRLAREKRS